MSRLRLCETRVLKYYLSHENRANESEKDMYYLGYSDMAEWYPALIYRMLRPTCIWYSYVLLLYLYVSLFFLDVDGLIPCVHLTGMI